MPQILTFGEILYRLQSSKPSIFEASKGTLNIYPGGSEANVAVALAQMGDQVQYFTAFPDNILAKEIKKSMQTLGVDCSKSNIQGDRIGSYILLSANGLSNGEVIYDRKYSSFSQLQAQDINFNTLFDDVVWLHWSALTPALSQEMAILMKILLQEASNRNITISVDLNYRSKLWQYGKSPREIMPSLVAYSDVIMGNIWAASNMLNCPIEDGFDRNTSKESYFEASKKSAEFIFNNYPKTKHIANTFRFMDHPKHNLFYGTYHSKSADNISETLETFNVTDRIGSGDAFMAGLIHALIHQFADQEVINFATGAGYQKLFVEGDFGNGKAF